jgi:CBS domain-containing protein
MQTVTVGEISKQSTMQALVVDKEMSLTEAIQQFATNHDLRGIFLTDKAGRLAGVINKQDLLRWVTVQLNEPAAGEPMSVGEMRRLLSAQRVADLASAGSEKTALRLDETVVDALRKMTYYKLSDVPVIDENSRIVNDLRLSEILAYMLNVAD